MQAVLASKVFTYPRKNCWPLHISKDLYLHFQSPHHELAKMYNRAETGVRTEEKDNKLQDRKVDKASKAKIDHCESR